MKVANVPMCYPYSAAENAVGLVLALNRKLVLGQRLMHIGDYRMDHLLVLICMEKLITVPTTSGQLMENNLMVLMLIIFSEFIFSQFLASSI